MRALASIAVVTFAIGGCSGSSPGGSDGGSGGDADAAAGGSGGLAGGGGSGGCAEPTGRGPSQPCCTDHGPDACGAGLFCAAFDGRRQATCYTERSRLPGQSCGDDLHCTSGSCNEAAAACRALPGTACEVEVGCAPAPSGDRYVCDPRDASPECAPVGTGGLGELCEDDGDCDVGSCTDLVCWTEGLCSDDPTGPCARDERRACNDCRRYLVEWCGVRECGAASGPFERCRMANGCQPPFEDASCGVEECRAEYCQLVACAEVSCDGYERCD